MGVFASIGITGMSGCGAGACSSSVRSVSSKYPIYCDESVMSQKEHGTCTQPLMKNLRWGVDWSTADKICCFNRHFAEYSGYFTTTEFMRESTDHGWPSFRDEEVVWDNVRSLRNGETVTLDGIHLGHNLPDGSGNRYCINLVSVAGQPPK